MDWPEKWDNLSSLHKDPERPHRERTKGSIMQKELIDLFESLPKRSEWVFCQANGEPYRQWHIYKPFKQILKALGIDTKQYSWKELRQHHSKPYVPQGSPRIGD